MKVVIILIMIVLILLLGLIIYFSVYHKKNSESSKSSILPNFVTDLICPECPECPEESDVDPEKPVVDPEKPPVVEPEKPPVVDPEKPIIKPTVTNYYCNRQTQKCSTKLISGETPYSSNDTCKSNCTLPIPSQFAVIVGKGRTSTSPNTDLKNSIAYTTDPLNFESWVSAGKDIFSEGMQVAYNGDIWVAVGQGNNSIAYSKDGMDWNGLRNNIFSQEYGGYKVVYNNNLWVAGGFGNNTIAYSKDGMNWTGIKNNVFSWGCLDILWNGKIWVAIGMQDDSSSNTNTIAYSKNGMNWTRVENSFDIIKDPMSIASNGTEWVIVGNTTSEEDQDYPLNNLFAYSEDGMNWSTANDITVNLQANLYFYSITTNGRLWVAVGRAFILVDNTNHTMTAYSNDGLNWTIKVMQNTMSLDKVVYNGNMWVAGNYYSYDGINWSGTYSDRIKTDIVWNNDMKKWFAIKSRGVTPLEYSDDGKTWKQQEGTVDSLRSPFYQSEFKSIAFK